MRLIDKNFTLTIHITDITVTQRKHYVIWWHILGERNNADLLAEVEEQQTAYTGRNTSKRNTG